MWLTEFYLATSYKMYSVHGQNMETSPEIFFIPACSEETLSLRP